MRNVERSASEQVAEKPEQDWRAISPTTPSRAANPGERNAIMEKPKDSPLSNREWQQAVDAGYLGDKPVEHRFESGWHAVVYKRNRKWGDYWIVHKYEAGKMCAQGGRHYTVSVYCDPPAGGRFGYAATHSTGTGGLPANLPADERAKIFEELEQELRNKYGADVITYPEVGSA